MKVSLEPHANDPHTDVLESQDGTAERSAKYPTVSVANDVPNRVALSQVFTDPNCFSFYELYPGGFTP